MKWKNKLGSYQKQILYSLILLIIFLSASLIKEPWHDELYTQDVVKKTFNKIFLEIKKDNYPPFYYFLIHILSAPFGYKIFSIRLFSALFVLFSSFILKKILKNYSISEDNLPYFIFLFPIPFYFSTEARCYSLIIFLSSLFFYEILIKKRPIFIFIYITLLSYTHYFSFFYFSYLAFLIIFKKEKRFISSAIFYLISIIPLLILFKNQPKESIFWTEPFLKLQSIFDFFSNLGSNLFKNYVYNFYPLIPPIIFSFFNNFIIFKNIKNKFLNILIYPFLFNIFVLFLFSFTYKNIYTPPRAESFFFFPFSLFVINFFKSNFKHVKFFKLFYLLISILSIFLIFISFLRPLPYNQEIEKILSVIDKETKICVIGYWKLTISYKLQERGYHNEIITFPPSQDEHQGWYYFKKFEERELKWFTQKVINSSSKYLILWDKNNPYTRDLVPLIPASIKVYSTENFNFAIKN